MIKLVFVNKNCQKNSFTDKIGKDTNLYKHLTEPKSENVRRERFLAYSSLLYLLDKLYGYTPCDISFSSKPHAIPERAGFSFNISHTDGATVIAFSDRYENIGVDIEGLIDKKRAENLSSRFLNFENEPNSNSALFEKISFFTLDEKDGGELVLRKLNLNDNIKNTATIQESEKILQEEISLIFPENPSEAHEATSKFTLLESALKCEGGGFASFNKADEILSKASSYSGWFKIGGREYSLSVSVL